jgi:hypothetical protein
MFVFGKCSIRKMFWLKTVWFLEITQIMKMFAWKMLDVGKCLIFGNCTYFEKCSYLENVRFWKMFGFKKSLILKTVWFSKIAQILKKNKQKIENPKLFEKCFLKRKLCFAAGEKNDGTVEWNNTTMEEIIWTHARMRERDTHLDTQLWAEPIASVVYAETNGSSA